MTVEGESLKVLVFCKENFARSTKKKIHSWTIIEWSQGFYLEESKFRKCLFQSNLQEQLFSVEFLDFGIKDHLNNYNRRT